MMNRNASSGMLPVHPLKLDDGPIAVFVATRWEAAAIRRLLTEEKRFGTFPRSVVGSYGHRRIVLIRTGVGTTGAEAVSRAAFATERFPLALSTGFAGSLGASQVGDLLVGTEVLVVAPSSETSHRSLVPCDGPLSDCAIEAAEAAGLPVHRGRLATVAEVLWRAEEKRRIAASTHAIGVDMESGVLGRWASERQIPFVVVRAVTDVLDEDLPLDFNLFLHPSRWAKGALACVLRPSCVFDLNRLRKQTIVASERLTRFLKRFFDTLR